MGRSSGGMKARQFRYYDLLVHIFVVLLLISNLVGQKITAIGPVRVGGAQLLFPLTYIFGDVFTEVYGYGASRRAIWIGFFASTLLSLMCVFMVWLPPAPGWNNQDAYRTVVYEVLATPLTYAIVNFLKRHEGVDTFDRRTNFNPFRGALEEPGIE